MKILQGRFQIGERVRHRIFGFRGVVYDVDPEFGNTEEWYNSIPKGVRPRKNQPFYHLLAETPDKAPYEAYVSEQNLVSDQDGDDPLDHPDMDHYFSGQKNGHFVTRMPLN